MNIHIYTFQIIEKLFWRQWHSSRSPVTVTFAPHGHPQPQSRECLVVEVAPAQAHAQDSEKRPQPYLTW